MPHISNSSCRTVQFPNDRSLGILFIRDRSRTGWLGWAKLSRRLGEARGRILVPARKDVCLLIEREAMSDLSPLLELKAFDLQALVFPLFSMNKESVFYIQLLTGLGLLRLEVSYLTSDEVYYLQELRDLRWLYLFCGRTSDQYLTALRHALPNCVVSLASRPDELPHNPLIRRFGNFSVEEMMQLANDNNLVDDLGQPFTNIEQFLLTLELDSAKRSATT